MATDIAWPLPTVSLKRIIDCVKSITILIFGAIKQDFDSQLVQLFNQIPAIMSALEMNEK